MNPFNDLPLTDTELEADCLCYLTHEGRQVKSSRLHIGPLHEALCEKLSVRFSISPDQLTQLRFDAGLLHAEAPVTTDDASDYAAAYHKGMSPLVDMQIRQLQRVIEHTSVTRIYVDGGFARNEVFMGMLSARLPALTVQAAEMPQASALGAAIGLSMR